MPITVVPTAYGRFASQALRDAVARAKHADALAPVTVVVPTNSVGVSARRRLASGDLGSVSSAGRGVVGVTFATVYRLAELLGAAELAAAGRRPVSTPVVASAVRRALARNAGLFAPVAQHPATEEALVAAHRELANLDSAQLDLLAAQHPRAREVVRLHRATKSLLEREWHDEHDLMRVATDVVLAGSRLVRELGTVVCFLPQRWTTPAARLLGALAEQTDLEIIVGLTGAPSADEQVAASLKRVGVELADRSAAGVAPVVGTEVWNASDPDDEVRAIVRGVVDAMRAGVPLERMAVLYASDDPYARLLHEHFNLADIAHNGATTRSMSECVLGRGLLRIFALADTAFARDDVCGLFASAPVLDGRGRPIPAAKWERLSRQAGVVRGIDEWRTRLDAYASGFSGDDERGARERAQAAALGAFVANLATDLQPDRLPRTWKGLAQFAHRLVRRYFGDEARRAAWPPFEKVAARRVESVLDRLGTLDTIDPAPTIEVFRRTFELELDAARDRVGSLGDGVLVGPVGMALGVDLDQLWVCGLAEGLFPSVPRDDPLLGDRERGVLGGELPLRSDRITDDERALLAALASTTHARVCTYPRGDLRRSTEHVPSRFLAATLAAVDAEHSIASYAYGATHVAFPANRHELEVRAAVGGEAWIETEPAVAHGLDLTTARASRSFTRFDGNLAHLADRLSVISPAHPQRVSSATRLQSWAACPHAYFMQSLLRVDPVEQPEDIMQLAPIDRGTLVHEVLDRFLGEARARVGAGRPWTEADRLRLRAIAEEESAATEARGLTGRRLLWHRDRRLILAELNAFLDADEKFRATGVAETLATELAFGMGEGAVGAVEVQIGDGRVVRVRGKADRVDRRADGVLVVVDYKTGSFTRYTSLSHDDPVGAGTLLQLPVYAYAARAAYGAADTSVEAYYWFVGKGNNRRIGYEVDREVENAFATAIRTIVDGIEGGVFPAQPPEPAPTPFVLCPFCDPDGMGTTDRWREWERKFSAPELDGLRSLSEPNAEGGR